MPSSEAVPDVRAGEQLDHNAFISVGVVGGGVELVFGRLVRWGAGVEAEAGEEQLSLIVHRESIEQRILGNVAGVGLGEGEGAVGGDVDLLATGHFDVLWKKLAKEYKGDDDPEREKASDVPGCKDRRRRSRQSLIRKGDSQTRWKGSRLPGIRQRGRPTRWLGDRMSRWRRTRPQL